MNNQSSINSTGTITKSAVTQSSNIPSEQGIIVKKNIFYNVAEHIRITR